MFRSCLMCMFFICLACAAASAQTPITYGDSTSFDFWIGSWNLTSRDNDSVVSRHENVITKILGGKVIREEFKSLTGPGAGFAGTSLSVLDPVDHRWHQTWVDNQGSYLDFVGSIAGDRRIFSRHAIRPDGTPVEQRMVFYNIAADVFDWDWERSRDGGSTWELQWRIHYERKR